MALYVKLWLTSPSLPEPVYVQAANVLLDEKDDPVIADFGLAKEMDVKDTHGTTAVKGTIGHIAPGESGAAGCKLTVRARADAGPLELPSRLCIPSASAV